MSGRTHGVTKVSSPAPKMATISSDIFPSPLVYEPPWLPAASPPYTSKIVDSHVQSNSCELGKAKPLDFTGLKKATSV
jgi:hypothetical protein